MKIKDDLINTIFSDPVIEKLATLKVIESPVTSVHFLDFDYDTISDNKDHLRSLESTGISRTMGLKLKEKIVQVATYEDTEEYTNMYNDVYEHTIRSLITKAKSNIISNLFSFINEQADISFNKKALWKDIDFKK